MERVPEESLSPPPQWAPFSQPWRGLRGPSVKGMRHLHDRPAGGLAGSRRPPGGGGLRYSGRPRSQEGVRSSLRRRQSFSRPLPRLLAPSLGPTQGRSIPPTPSRPLAYLQTPTSKSGNVQGPHRPQDLRGSCQGKLAEDDLSIQESQKLSRGRRAPVRLGSMASFYRWEKRGPTQGIPLL